MSKQNKQSIQEKLQKRTPASLRQVIKPVDMLETEQDQTNERTSEQTDERLNERTNERSTVRTNERRRVRHSFDIYQDQLLSLKEIAISREQEEGKRVLLGDLVQEALDAFIKHERTNETTNG